MIPAEEDFATRREQLATETARQRGQLAHAYRELEKPIRYAEYGMRGIGFLRSNPWIFIAVPGAFSLLTNLLGLRKKKAPEPARAHHSGEKLKGVKGAIVTGAKYAWQAYQLYRRVRP